MDHVGSSNNAGVQMTNAVIRAIGQTNLNWIPDIVDEATCTTKFPYTNATQGTGDNWYDAILKGSVNSAKAEHDGEVSFEDLWRLVARKEEEMPDSLPCENNATRFDSVLMSRLVTKAGTVGPTYQVSSGTTMSTRYSH